MSAVKMGLTIEEAAECTGIGRNTMRKLVDWGKLPVLKVGRKTIIRRDTLERFMTINQGRYLLREGDVRGGESPCLGQNDRLKKETGAAGTRPRKTSVGEAVLS